MYVLHMHKHAYQKKWNKMTSVNYIVVTKPCRHKYTQTGKTEMNFCVKKKNFF